MSLDTQAAPVTTPPNFPETTVEQTQEGGFRRQRNYFPGRFGTADDQIPVIPNRYVLFANPGCGWGRRQLIVRRLLGLEPVLPVEILEDRDEHGWKVSTAPGSLGEKFGTNLLNDFYRRTDPGFQGRGTSPTVIDAETGLVVSNSYHSLPLDWEVAWRPFHKEGAPDLYPVELRQEIDLLNQQIFDDINNGTYKVNFATKLGPARVAKGVFEARLADYDLRLATRRYLFGDRITDSDVRLFQSLATYDRGYRPRFPKELGTAVLLSDFPNLHAYARDLFQNGFIDDRELYYLGLIPGPDGTYAQRRHDADADLPTPQEALAAWREPHGREALGGSPYYTGPGSGGSFELWHFARGN